MEREPGIRDEIVVETPEAGAGEVIPVRVAGAVDLELTITDTETCAELKARAAGRARHDFAAHALNIGVLAIRQAQGRIDADAVRNEGDRLITELGQLLRDHHEGVNRTVATSLKDYFDPESGRFNERVERLIKSDGELALIRNTRAW